MLFNREAGRVMMIDFERASLAKPPYYYYYYYTKDCL
jgi:hypothetical protein